MQTKNFCCNQQIKTARELLSWLKENFKTLSAEGFLVTLWSWKQFQIVQADIKL